MADGTVIEPAGKLPRVWRDGQPEDFGKWDSYEVRTGEKIIEQKWGGDSLTARAGGGALTIRIAPATAKAAWSGTSKIK